MQSFAYRPFAFRDPTQMLVNLLKTRRPTAFQFNISENWQQVALLSPCFVTPTWLLVALTDISHCSKGCNLAEKLGISVPDPSGTNTQTHVLLIFLLLLQFCFPEISAAPECLSALPHTDLTPKGDLAL